MPFPQAWFRSHRAHKVSDSRHSIANKARLLPYMLLNVSADHPYAFLILRPTFLISRMGKVVLLLCGRCTVITFPLELTGNKLLSLSTLNRQLAPRGVSVFPNPKWVIVLTKSSHSISRGTYPEPGCHKALITFISLQSNLGAGWAAGPVFMSRLAQYTLGLSLSLWLS